MSDRKFNLCLIVYVVMAIITFGQSYNDLRASVQKEAILIGAFGCAAAWPLYWSVVLFETRKP